MYCLGLTKITLPGTLKCIRKSAFSHSGIECIVLPNSIETVDDFAFYECKLKQIVFSGDVKSMGQACFGRCHELKKAVLPSNLEVISQGLFEDCSALSEVTLPKNLKHIEREAFYKTNLSHLECPENTIIGKSVFDAPSIYGCEFPPSIIPRVHFTLDDSGEKMHFQTYSEDDEARFNQIASQWKYDRTYSESHETWYEDTEKDGCWYEDLKSDQYLIQNHELVGVCIIGGTISSSVWRTDRNLALEQLFFDCRNGKRTVTYDVYSGNDEFSRSNNEAWTLCRAKENTGV